MLPDEPRCGQHRIDTLTCATQGCWQISSILMRLFGSLSTMLLIRRFTSWDVAGLHQSGLTCSASVYSQQVESDRCSRASLERA